MPLVNDGYAVGINPAFYHSAYVGSDHTTGTGNMMIVNGGIPNGIVWQQILSVNPQHIYSFSAWACAVYTVNPTNLEVLINGVVVASATTNSPVNVWNQVTVNWNSGSSFMANIIIRATNTTGSNNGVDFGLDDISFACADCNPASQFSTSSQTICVGQSVNFNVLSPGLYTYLWNFGDHSTSSQLNPVHTFSAANVYTVTLQCSNSLATATSLVKITVLPYPTLAVTGNTLICHGDTASLNLTGATTYSWNGGSASPTVTLNPPVTTSYTLVGANMTCTNSAVVTVSVNPSPGIISADLTKATCGLSDGTATLVVDPPTSLVSWSNGHTGNTAGNLSSGNYTINVSTPSCSTQSILTIEALTIIISSSLVIPAGCEDDGEFIIKELKGGSNPYLVNFNHTGYNSESRFPKLKPGVYPLEIMDINKCTNSFSVEITSNEEGNTYIPNAFTPNNDGLNDVWYIINTCIKSYACSIFDRWGTKLAELTDINEGWNGTCKGKIVPDGVYVYTVALETYNGKSIKKSGHITLTK